jgi:NADPH:quinone reductase-like Zn-dependent oxidoreductase
VIALDTLELRPIGPKDVHLRILAVSAEHNIDHASTADTGNIADRRGGKMYPGNSATGEVLAVGALVTKFEPGDIVITHCNGGPDEYGFPTRIWAYDADDSIGWYAKEAVVGDWQIIRAPLDCGSAGDRGDAARADGITRGGARSASTGSRCPTRGART